MATEREQAVLEAAKAWYRAEMKLGDATRLERAARERLWESVREQWAAEQDQAERRVADVGAGRG